MTFTCPVCKQDDNAYDEFEADWSFDEEIECPRCGSLLKVEWDYAGYESIWAAVAWAIREGPEPQEDEPA